MSHKNSIKISFLFIIIILSIFSYGCNQNNPSDDNIPDTPIVLLNNSQSTEEGINSIVDANNQFAIDLYSRYKSKDENIFFSPYSISSALTMTYEGAKGNTAQEMQQVLHLTSDKNAIRSSFAEIYNNLNKEDKPYKLSTANALWAQEDYPFIEDYFNTINEYYGGGVTNLDFKTDTEESRQTINNWVEDNTNGKIKDIIPKGILSDMTRLVLTNAVYFKANWSDQFDVEITRDGIFRLNSGQNKEVEMMHKTSYFNYGETDNLQILEMPYLGDELSMLIILPKENNIGEIENIFTINNLKDWKDNMKNEEVVVALPKFKFETKYFMAEDLKEMGMPTAFKYPDADFTGMSPPTVMSPNGELYIDEVIHQTFVEVAEYGTEAAAATVVEMKSGSSGPPPEPPKVFNADHPFIFIIQEKSTGNMLFVGRVIDPS
ncbi:MAG: serpin family protein [archaeon]